MHLISVTDMSLREVSNEQYHEQDQPIKNEYAILSHRWESIDQEPTFEEFKSRKLSLKKIGVRKIRQCCKLAHKHGLKWLWVDTCCIDKRSSAELQEAINSMYRIYQRAAVCFVYLRDVKQVKPGRGWTDSEWFTRGWTLQELLAPRKVIFHDCDWAELGEKSNLAKYISNVTNIPLAVLNGQQPVWECSVAQRMSWAAGRKTSRLEDRAYSLLGLFDLNMPMLYGEGAKAFVRLQEEIIRTLDDPSIFAWEGINSNPGLLAQTPDMFASSGDIRTMRDRTARHPYLTSSRGISVKVPLFPYTLDTYLLKLPCYICDPEGDYDYAELGIFIQRLYEDHLYMRVAIGGEALMYGAEQFIAEHGLGELSVEREINVPHRMLLPFDMKTAYMTRVHGFRICRELLRTDDGSEIPVITNGGWDPLCETVSVPEGSAHVHRVGCIDIGLLNCEIEVIRFGFDQGYNPIVFLTRRGVHYSEKQHHEFPFIQEFVQTTEYGKPSLDPKKREVFQNGEPVSSSWAASFRGKSLSLMSRRVEGLWQLRGDRLDGLDTHLIESYTYVIESYSREEPDISSRIARVQLRRDLSDSGIVWELSVTELAKLPESAP